MSRPFAKNNGKTTFAQFKEPLNASQYTLTKKIKNEFCKPDYCQPNKNVYSQSNYIRLKQVNYIELNPCNNINNTQLYINLITKLDLSNNAIVVTDLSGNGYPVRIDTTVEPYLKYNIDPNGNLFGNTVCGVNNFENYLAYNKPSKIDNPGNINNL
jgi:hypothetical protein